MPLTPADNDISGLSLFGPYLPNYPWTRYSRLRASCEVLRGQNWDVAATVNPLAASTSDSPPDEPERPVTASEDE